MSSNHLRKFMVITLFLLNLFLVSTQLQNANDSSPSYSKDTPFNILYWVMKFNVTDGKLLNVSLYSVSDFTIKDIRENYYKIAINESTHEIKNDSRVWTRIALMAWHKNGYPTVIYQTFQIGQVIVIKATGCKKGHCKTKYKTAGSTDNVLVLWSCKEYDFAKFQGKVDLRNCRIANVIHHVPFIYGRGKAVKENIKNKVFLERDFGEINKYFNTSAANLYGIIDAIIKVQQNDPALKNRYNAWVYYNILTNYSLEKQGITPSSLKNFEGMGKISFGPSFSITFGDLLIGAGIGTLSGLAAGFVWGGPIGWGVGIITGLVVLALQGCSEGGSADAKFDHIYNFYDYIINYNCGSFCTRETYSGNKNPIKEGNGFITSPVGDIYYPGKLPNLRLGGVDYSKPIYPNVLGTMVTILKEFKNQIHILEQKYQSGQCSSYYGGPINTNTCEEYVKIIKEYNVENITDDLIDIFSNQKLLTMGEAWALFMAYFDYLKSIGLSYPVFEHVYKYEVVVEEYFNRCDAFNARRCRDVKTYYPSNVQEFCRQYNCVSKKELSFYDYWINIVLKEVNRQTVDYGGSIARANILDAPYNSFGMTAEVFTVRLKDLLLDPNTYLGVVKEKAGELPYFVDHEGNKHYLIQPWEVENKTYYLPAIMLIEEPIVGKAVLIS